MDCTLTFTPSRSALGYLLATACAISAACTVNVGEDDDAVAAAGAPAGNSTTTQSAIPGAGGSTGQTATTPAGGAGGAASGAATPTTTEPGSVATLTDDCSAGTDLPNTRDTAVPLAASQHVCTRNEDEDWFYYDAPDDGKSHTLDFLIKPKADDSAWIHAYLGDGTDLGYQYSPNVGAEFQVHVVLGAKAHGLFQFTRAGSGGEADVTVTLGTEQDTYEPNNSDEQAATIALNQDITAQMLTSAVTQVETTTYDWYKAELTPGTYAIRVTAVPDDIQLAVQVSDPNGVSLFTEYAANTGALFTRNLEVETAGVYTLGLFASAGTADIFYSGARPDSFSAPYTFRLER
jgi:hypothetical protein